MPSVKPVPGTRVKHPPTGAGPKPRPNVNASLPDHLKAAARRELLQELIAEAEQRYDGALTNCEDDLMRACYWNIEDLKAKLEREQ